MGISYKNDLTYSDPLLEGMGIFNGGGNASGNNTAMGGAIGALAGIILGGLNKEYENIKNNNPKTPINLPNKTETKTESIPNQGNGLPLEQIAQPGITAENIAGAQQEIKTETGTTNIPITTQPGEQKPVEEVKPETPDITDETNKNIEFNINAESYVDFLRQLQQEQWAREDQIREAVWAREDNAYQRAVADAKKAGMNINLTGVNPAESGGGITQATGMNTSLLETQINNVAAQTLELLKQNFNGTENDWNRLTQNVGNVMSLIGQIGMAYAISLGKTGSI